MDGVTYETAFTIERDPRIEASPAELRDQFDFLMEIRNRLDRMNKAVIDIRSINSQIDALFPDEVQNIELRENVSALKIALRGIEQNFVQVNAEARKDLHANPVALNDKLYRLSNFASRVEAAPTPTQQDMLIDFSEPVEEMLAEFDRLTLEEIPRLNQALLAQGYPGITLPEGYMAAGDEISAQMAN